MWFETICCKVQQAPQGVLHATQHATFRRPTLVAKILLGLFLAPAAGNVVDIHLVAVLQYEQVLSMCLNELYEFVFGAML